MNPSELLQALHSSLGPTERQWEMYTAHTKYESAIVIRLDSTIKKGHLTRLHNRIQSLLEEELGLGDRL